MSDEGLGVVGVLPALDDDGVVGVAVVAGDGHRRVKEAAAVEATKGDFGAAFLDKLEDGDHGVVGQWRVEVAVGATEGDFDRRGRLTGVGLSNKFHITLICRWSTRQETGSCYDIVCRRG